MPKFVYTILITILLIFGVNLLVMNFLNPETIYAKIIFVVLFFLIVNLITSMVIVFLNITSKEKSSLINIFKQAFKKYLITSALISLLLFLKLFKLLSLSSFIIISIAVFLIPKALHKIKKTRNRRIY